MASKIFDSRSPGGALAGLFLGLAILGAVIFLTSTGTTPGTKVLKGSAKVPHEVSNLRKFRDKYLLTNRPGRNFVRYYYKFGPRAADAIRDRERLKALVRMCLLPLVYIGQHPYLTLGLFTVAVGWWTLGTLAWIGRAVNRRLSNMGKSITRPYAS
ncbi:MAG: hypothetical protein HQK58_04700 [Deltaproteobacteria bacterium]|nr:hypothetical protein [Deltaproteobacteria bacterium]